jgi:Predicted membrane protein
MELQTNRFTSRTSNAFAGVLILVMVLGYIALLLSGLPGLEIAGPMIIGIMMGLILTLIAHPQASWNPGLDFSAKYYLRAGIILMGFRLNIMDILRGGANILIADAVMITFILCVMFFLSRKLGVDEETGFLISVGTAICGAAAIMAAASVNRASKAKQGVSVSIVAILGTLFAACYIFLAPLLLHFMNLHQLSGLMGVSLEEIAHVVAAGSVLPAAYAGNALITKLGRVILLAPVILVLDIIINVEERKKSGGRVKVQFPLFVLGFLGVSILNSLGIISKTAVNVLLYLSQWLLAASMIAIGLNLKIADFRKEGIRPILFGAVGFACIFILTPLFLFFFK